MILERDIDNYIICSKQAVYKNQYQSNQLTELGAAKHVFKRLLIDRSNDSLFHLFNELDAPNHLKSWLTTKAPYRFTSLLNTIRTEFLEFFPVSMTYTNELTGSTLLTINHLAKTHSGAYRGFVFSELYDKQDICWHPVINIHYMKLRELYLKDKYINGQSAKLFIISFNPYSKNYIVNSIKKSYWSNTHKLILDKALQNITQKTSYPLIPCKLDCPYKEICKP